MKKNKITKVSGLGSGLSSLSGSEFEKILLIIKYIIWPPSKSGIGNKLNNPTNKEITINKNRTPLTWSSIIWSAFLTIPIGPANWSPKVFSL